VTGVEYHSTARGRVSRNQRRLAALLTGAVVTSLLPVALSATPGSADSLGSDQAQAAQIEAQLQADSQHLDAISQQYEQDQQRVAQLDQQLAQTRAAIARDKAHVATERSTLRTAAINAYVTGGDDSGLVALFGPGGEQGTVTDEYQAVATGNVADTIDALGVAKLRLDAQQTRLQTTEQQARATLNQQSAARQAAEGTVANQQSLLASVKGRIATLIAQQQAAEAAAEHAAFEARVAAEAAASTPAPASSSSGATPSGGGPGQAIASAPTLNLPAAGGAARAVAAAESQLGVPYVWGGETPGVGFDCSGLTQWSWAQAGVDLPRTAQEQYDAIAHISLNDLEPGDLLFWSDGDGITHVGMYVGGGDIIDAPETGEVVQIQPIWNNGLVGAGRP
jgi:peptidoglycan DL-endopeptidase CwlO